MQSVPGIVARPGPPAQNHQNANEDRAPWGLSPDIWKGHHQAQVASIPGTWMVLLPELLITVIVCGSYYLTYHCNEIMTFCNYDKSGFGSVGRAVIVVNRRLVVWCSHPTIFFRCFFHQILLKLHQTQKRIFTLCNQYSVFFIRSAKSFWIFWYSEKCWTLMNHLIILLRWRILPLIYGIYTVYM